MGFAGSAIAALVAILAEKYLELILRGCLRTQSALGKIRDVVFTSPPITVEGKISSCELINSSEVQVC